MIYEAKVRHNAGPGRHQPQSSVSLHAYNITEFGRRGGKLCAGGNDVSARQAVPPPPSHPGPVHYLQYLHPSPSSVPMPYRPSLRSAPAEASNQREEFDVKGFCDRMHDYGRAYRHCAIELINICQRFAAASEQSCRQYLALSR
jgi:hypothetical protein